MNRLDVVAPVCGIWDLGCGMRNEKREMRDVECGISGAGRGAWGLGSGVWNLGPGVWGAVCVESAGCRGGCVGVEEGRRKIGWTYEYEAA